MKGIKKLLRVFMAVLCVGVIGMGFAACGGARDEIVLAQREAGSGTRDAFESVFGLKNQVAARLDYSTTGSLKQAVASDKYAIGYISVGSVDTTVKALKIDGVEASEENILSDSYKAHRPFNMITSLSVENSAAVTDFLSFIYSNEGQNVVSGAELIKAQADDGATGAAYATAKDSIAATKIKISGSTSMEEVVLSLVESYNGKQSNVTFETSFGGSSAGKTDVAKTDNSRADIGLVSSALSSGDLGKFNGYKIATDGIAIIVNAKNAVSELTTDQIQKIFKADIKNWSEISVSSAA